MISYLEWGEYYGISPLNTCINNRIFFLTTCTMKKFTSKLDINKYILNISIAILVNDNLVFEEARKHFSALFLPYYVNSYWRCYQKWAAVIFQPASATLPLANKCDFNTICTLHYLSTVSWITGRDIPLMSIKLVLIGRKQGG